jgi:hypothetical protein
MVQGVEKLPYVDLQDPAAPHLRRLDPQGLQLEAIVEKRGVSIAVVTIPSAA